MKTINIPQGYSGILDRKPSLVEINGLYTQGFSTCNIVMCVSNSQIFLMHVGVNDAKSLLADIEKVKGKLIEVHIFYRPQEQLAVTLKNQILDLLDDNLDKGPGIEIKAYEVKEQEENVLICVEDNEQICIKLDKQEPDFLLRHPDELQIETVQKIRQVIGIRSLKEKSMDHTPGQITNIFDGVAWTKIPANQLVIDDGTERTSSEIKYCTAENSLEQITLRLHKLVQAIQNNGILVSEDIDLFDIAMHLELYLNKYDHALVFKRDIRTILDLSRVEPSTDGDKKFAKEIEDLANGAGDVYKAFAQSIKTYKERAQQTDYKEYILKQYDVISSLYTSRDKFNKTIDNYNLYVLEAKTKNAMAREHYQKGQYPEAANLFLDALKLLTYSCLGDDTRPKATRSCYNMVLERIAKCGEVQKDVIEEQVEEVVVKPKPRQDVTKKRFTY